MKIYLFKGTLKNFIAVLPYLWENADYGDKLQSNSAHNPEFFTQSVILSDDHIQRVKKPTTTLFRKTSNLMIHGFSSKDFYALEQTPSFLNYMKLQGTQGFTHLADPAVGPVIKAARKTLSEAHRLKGLLRFRQIRSILYAPYFSVNFVLPILGSHFKKRLPNQQWLLHDRERETGLFYNGKSITQAFFNDSKALELEKMYEQAGIEDDFEKLWIKYFNTIAIKERFNPKLQQSFMPKQYWRFIPEVAERLQTYSDAAP